MAAKNRSGRAVPVPSWLLAGSFEPLGEGLILSWPYLPEEDLAPSFDGKRGEKLGNKGWKRVDSPGGSVDLLRTGTAQGFERTEHCAAYAFVWMNAREAAPAKLLVGSDDGVAVWLNGERVHFNELQRGHTPGEDVVEVKLARGWNRLLLKISQLVGRWEFSCSVDARTKLRFALENPSPKRFPGPKAAGLALGVGAITPTSAGDACRVTVKVMNRGTRALKNVAVELNSPEGDTLASGSVASLPGVEIGALDLEADTKTLAAALGSAGGTPLVEAKSGRVRAEASVPAEAALGLVVSLAAGRPGSDAARGARRVFDTFGTSGVAGTALVSEALAAFASNDEAAFESKLGELKDAALAGVPDRKGDVARLVGHAHIDMNWLWTWRETVQSCQDSFRQAVAFMDEFPAFRFSQSQSACYRAIEATDPVLFERIRGLVKEGHWELTGGMHTEGDTNLSSGEALARSFLEGQRYFLDRFGKAARVGWLPDNFGHVSQLPQMLRLAGCDFYYFHRCRPHLGSFWWEGPDGSRVLCYSNFGYNGNVNRDLAREFDNVVPRTKRLMHVYGVGDHGGGPTREYIENAIALNETPRFPTVEFSTAEEFFQSEEPLAADRPVHTGEMQFTFDGCYSTITRVKEGNRRCESALYAAELLASLRTLAGEAYPAEEFRRAWRIVTFNEFHDILCGSAIYESNAEAVADYKWARSRAEFERTKALRALADEVRADASLGTPVVVFNPQPRTRTQLVEVEFYSHGRPAGARLAGWSDYYGARHSEGAAGAGTPACIEVRDSAGKALPAQIVGGQSFPPGWRTRVQFVSEDLPAGGYRTYYLRPQSEGEFTDTFAVGKQGEVETDFFEVAFDMKTGEIKALFDKRTGRDVVSAKATGKGAARGSKGGGANRLRIYMEKPHGMSAWVIGETAETFDLTDAEYVRVTEAGPVRTCVEALKRWGNSKFVQRTWVYRSYPRVDFELEAHWFDYGVPGEPHPMLRAVFPLALGGDDREIRFDCHVPYDVVSRPTDGTEVPAQQWVDVTDGTSGVALLNETKYGHSFVRSGEEGQGKGDGGELRLTLLRASNDPDLYPDQGMHFIRYSLFPHEGDWKSGVWQEAEAVNFPALSAEPPSASLRSKEPTRPPEASLVSLKPRALVLSTLKQSEDVPDGEGTSLVVRLVEVEGADTEAVLTFPREVKSAERVDLIERPLGDAPSPTVDGRTVRVKVRPHEIVSLRVAL